MPLRRGLVVTPALREGEAVMDAGMAFELAAKVAGRESAMDPKTNRAREILDNWQAGKRKAKAA